MVDLSTSNRHVLIRIQLVVKFNNKRVNNLIGKVSSCQEGGCRFEADLTR